MKENILGIDVCPINMEGALRQADEIIKSRVPGFIVAINPEKIMKALSDDKLKELLNSAYLQIPDGVGILIASKIKHGRVKDRVTGVDLMMNICRHASQKGYRVYMLGAAPGIAEKAAARIRDMYPGIVITGTHDGYFKDNEQVVVDEISKSNSDILFVAMGSPSQEYWIKSNMWRLNVPLLMGVGGSLDVMCGNIKRAPLWMRKLGLEWMFRLIKEPWRIKRMMALPVFLLKVMRT